MLDSQVYAASKDELKKKLVGVATEVHFLVAFLLPRPTLC
jgi:hypothetical protein